MQKLMAMVAVAMAAGCAVSTPGLPEEPGTSTDTLAADLRLRGKGGGATWLGVTVADLEITAAGQPVAFDYDTVQLNLAQTDQAWRVATLAVPKTADVVHVKVWLDEAGGVVKDGTGAELDTRGRPLEFDVPMATFTEKGKATLELDLDRALVRGSRGYTLLPHYRLW